MRDSFLPFSRPSITDAEINEVVDSMKSGWITTGPKTKQFETMLANYFDAPYAMCLSSATAGLHLVMSALDLKPEDEVITTPMTFAATLNVIEIAGAKVKLVDADKTYNMDVTQLRAAITPNTKAIMPVHFTGASVDLDPVYALAKEFNLRVIEDAAQAIGTEYKGKKIGSFGDTQVFSFHPNKNITTGEGGCVVTRDAKLAKKFCLMRFHGMDREAWDRFGKKGNQYYQIVYPGLKYNMMDIQSAMGIHQLPRLESFIIRRTQLAKRYYALLKDQPWFTLPVEPSFEHRHAWHLFAPLLNTAETGITRDQLMTTLKERNIGSGLHYQAIHLYPYYQDKYGFKSGDFPIAEHIGNHIISLPLFPDMTDAEQDDVIAALNDIFNTK